MTKCTFHKYGPSGTVENKDGLCILAQNIINEKIYIFLWFWSVFKFIQIWFRLIKKFKLRWINLLWVFNKLNYVQFIVALQNLDQKSEGTYCYTFDDFEASSAPVSYGG